MGIDALIEIICAASCNSEQIIGNSPQDSQRPQGKVLSHPQGGEAALSNAGNSLLALDEIAFCFCREFSDFHAPLKLECTPGGREGDAQFAGKADCGNEWIARKRPGIAHPLSGKLRVLGIVHALSVLQLVDIHGAGCFAI
jgi:hypothetical protein